MVGGQAFAEVAKMLWAPKFTYYTVQHKLEVVRNTTTLDLIFLCGWFYSAVDTTSIPGLRSAFL